MENDIFQVLLTEKSMEKIEIAERFSKPKNSETAPYMTIIKVIEGIGKDEHIADYYIQVNKKKGEATWITIGDFLSTAMEHLFESAAFIEEVTLLYEISLYKNKPILNSLNTN